MIRPIIPTLREPVRDVFIAEWGSPQMVISTGTYDCATLDGFVAMEEATIIGLITYVIREEELEIISLDSLRENRGIGSSLLDEVERLGRLHGLKRMSLITTNDNLRALAFYQKRGWRLAGIIPGAVDEARLQKPSIPMIGEHGIPLHDEIILSKVITT
ncbi:GNAT family N-acetyltransferase [Exiguobacterium sp. SH1S21]|uniref:GNAT family N-acetyltransferase n=1 Tax=unclassified Exiguobacterium TaxID=2644629 RepID=UPI001039DB2B|nr:MULTISPECIES: GNAT family N-acetyltransferase [unclassified Exiguobacterium]TCI54131.1 GNAT family N-acetyltransferase [Exiguobacterium sp. SH1S21]TCI69770.1 GNAT family N-acetyltransferase [Exiguobacterium sp. SH0S7]